MLEGTSFDSNEISDPQHAHTQVTKKNKWVTPPLAFLLVTIFIANVYLVRVYQNAISSQLDGKQSIVLGLDSKHGRANDSVSKRWVSR
jgi:hypothetical protein